MQQYFSKYFVCRVTVRRLEIFKSVFCDGFRLLRFVLVVELYLK